MKCFDYIIEFDHTTAKGIVLADTPKKTIGILTKMPEYRGLHWKRLHLHDTISYKNYTYENKESAL